MTHGGSTPHSDCRVARKAVRKLFCRDSVEHLQVICRGLAARLYMCPSEIVRDQSCQYTVHCQLYVRVGIPGYECEGWVVTLPPNSYSDSTITTTIFNARSRTAVPDRGHGESFGNFSIWGASMQRIPQRDERAQKLKLTGTKLILVCLKQDKKSVVGVTEWS